MTYVSRPILSLCFLAVSAYGSDDKLAAPQAESVEPRVGKAGTILRVVGKSLCQPAVDEVYLTDHRFDLKVKVLEQTETSITFRVPPFVKPGRLQLLFLTGGKNPVFLEQPFYVQIEEGEEAPLPAPVQVSKSKKGKTVEIASNGSHIPVPPAPAAAPMTSPAVRTAPAEKPVAAGGSKKTAKADATVEVAQNNAVKNNPGASAQPQTPSAAVTQTPAVTTTPQPQQQQPQAAPATPAVTPQQEQPQQPQDLQVVAAQVIRRSRVTYPAAASAAKVEGAVELIAVVKADGHVKEVRVVKGNPYLVPAAVASVREWLYEPARLNGKVIESEVNIVLNFKRPN